MEGDSEWARPWLGNGCGAKRWAERVSIRERRGRAMQPYCLAEQSNTADLWAVGFCGQRAVVALNRLGEDPFHWHRERPFAAAGAAKRDCTITEANAIAAEGPIACNERWGCRAYSAVLFGVMIYCPQRVPLPGAVPGGGSWSRCEARAPLQRGSANGQTERRKAGRDFDGHTVPQVPGADEVRRSGRY